MVVREASTATWKKKAWKAFADYIKARDGNVCVTCGTTILKPRNHQAGHFIPKEIGGPDLYFEETNVHSQCGYCNRNLGGWGEKYNDVMLQRYGQKHVKMLKNMRNNRVHRIFDKLSLQLIFERYTTMLSELNVNNHVKTQKDDKTND